MMNIHYLLLFLILTFSVHSQNVGINTTNPQATLHVGGTFKFNPKPSVNATRLVGVTPNGAVREFELGDNFVITNGKLETINEVDENTYLVGEVDQTPTSGSGQYNNFNIGLEEINTNNTIIRVTGETGGYNVTGFADGFHGRIFYFYNAQNQNVTFYNKNAASAPGNQIITGSGANVGIAGQGVAEFIYHGTLEKWILINIRN